MVRDNDIFYATMICNNEKFMTYFATVTIHVCRTGLFAYLIATCTLETLILELKSMKESL